MNTRTMLTLIAFGGTLALVACSSDDSDKFGSSDAYCSARAEAECNGLAKPCGTTIDACEKGRTVVCTQANSAAQAAGRTYHSGQVQACIDSINDTYKDNGANVTPELEAKTAAICDAVYTGSVAENGACTATADCQAASDPLICDLGICVHQTTVALKGQCNNAGDICDTGSYCQQQGQTKFCVAKNAMGDTCGADAPCLETLRCVNTCQPRVGVNQSCNSDDDCASQAPFCDPTTKKCIPKYESSSSACSTYGQ